MNSNIIEIKDVTFSYDEDTPNQKTILKNINLSVKRGSFTVILGHNGSGKSTLAKLLNGLILPDSGSVIVDGMTTSDESKIYNIRTKLGMVFQNPDNQIVCTVVEEDVAFGPENLGLPPEEIQKRVTDSLKQVGMLEHRSKAPYKLSGGQKQRIALAGILAMKPDCIVLDEPTAMLDPIGRKEVMQTIKKLNSEQGITIVLITHFMEDTDYADRVLVMDNGEIISDTAPDRLFERSDVINKAGISLPQTVELIDILNKNGLKVEKNVISANDTADAIMRAIERKLP